MRAGSQDPARQVTEVQPCNPHPECEPDFGSRGLDDLLYFMGAAHGNGTGGGGLCCSLMIGPQNTLVFRIHSRAFARQVQADGAWGEYAREGDCPRYALIVHCVDVIGLLWMAPSKPRRGYYAWSD